MLNYKHFYILNMKSAILNFLLKWAFFLGSYVYVLLFHFNGNKKNLFIAIKVKLLNLHIGAW